MTYATYFEIGGDLVELKAEYDYQTGRIPKKERAGLRKLAKDLNLIGSEVESAMSEDSYEMGTGETIGHWIGFGIGLGFAVATFPITQADTPLIGPADVAWMAASLRFTSAATSTGEHVGALFD